MKTSDDLTLPRVASWPFLFWAMAASLWAIHLTLTLYSGDTNLLFSSLIFWMAAYVALKEEAYQPANQVQSLVLGLLLLLPVLVYGLSAEGQFLYLFPVLVGLGLVCLFTGLAGLRKYWKALVLLFLLGVPEVIATAIVDPAPLTARFSDTLLWYAGFDVTRQGLFIQLWESRVEVNQACSGLRAMMRMLSIAALALLLLPRRWSLPQILGLPLLGILIAFIANGFRVALLVLLLASGHQEAFDSFHGGNFSQSFSMLSILVFMSLVGWIVQRPTTLHPTDFHPTE